MIGIMLWVTIMLGLPIYTGALQQYGGFYRAAENKMGMVNPCETLWI